MTDLYPMQQKIKIAIEASLDANLPVAIQIGQRAGKEVILKSILESSTISGVLIIGQHGEYIRRSLKGISFVDIITPSSFMRNYYDLDVKDVKYTLKEYSIIVLHDPWWWDIPSEGAYKFCTRVNRKVLAIGSYNEGNKWSFDAVIPKYATVEVNPNTTYELDKRVLSDPRRTHLSYGRNI